MNNEITSAEIASETLNETEMPSKQMPEKKHRYWCATCGDYELFSSTEEDYTCDKCSTKKVDVELSTIPEEKVEEQRNRFRNMRRHDFARMMEVYQFMSQNPNSDMPILKSESIMETDAGLLAIEQEEREKKAAEQEAIRQDIEAHRHIGRNDKCQCGSGLKYKKCCLKRIQSYR